MHFFTAWKIPHLWNQHTHQNGEVKLFPFGTWLCIFRPIKSTEELKNFSITTHGTQVLYKLVNNNFLHKFLLSRLLLAAVTKLVPLHLLMTRLCVWPVFKGACLSYINTFISLVESHLAKQVNKNLKLPVSYSIQTVIIKTHFKDVP